MTKNKNNLYRMPNPYEPNHGPFAWLGGSVLARAREYNRLAYHMNPTPYKEANRRRKWKALGTDSSIVARSMGDPCPICFQAATSNVDHGHVSGKARGALCVRCNTLLGYALEDPRILERAILYLRLSERGRFISGEERYPEPGFQMINMPNREILAVFENP